MAISRLHPVVEQDGADIVIRIRSDAACEPADELVPFTRDGLAKFEIEYAPALEHAQSGKLRTCWLGRKRFTKRSWLLELLDVLPPAVADEPDDDIANAARKRAAKAVR